MGSQTKRTRSIFWSVSKMLLASLFVLIILLRFEIIGHPMLNMSFRHSDKRLLKQFNSEGLKPEIKYLKSKRHAIRYLIMESDINFPYIVFIHGAPGSLSDYLGFFKDKRLQDQVNLISIDRPGYGYSEFGKSETSIAAQADAIQSVISATCKNDQVILIGHSYGGPVVVKICMDNPGVYRAAILLAPALDPKHEKEIMLSALPKLKVIRWLIPPALSVAADEKNSHIEELQKIEPGYRSIRTPVYHIHGDADSLVPYENLAYSISWIDEEYLEAISLIETDHFLPWSHHDYIVNMILDIISGS
jgi:pimeloyl-ACP methyl ester carboxylesterase